MTQLTGVDVSHYQENVDWNAVKEAGYTFAFAKCTGGLTFNDPKFQMNWKGIAAAGMLRGTYHFYYNNDDPTKQAEHFLSLLGTLNAEDLPPVLDLEGGGIVDKNLPIEQYQQDVLTWLRYVEQKLGRKPMIYTAPNFGNEYLDNCEFAAYDLWLAEYGVNSPQVPNAWAEKGWRIWQNASDAVVSGIVGKTDHDLFNGTLEQLKML